MYQFWYTFADEAEASSSSWGSDAEDSNPGNHNSVWTLEFQAADDPAEFADTVTFQSSADFDHDNADKMPSVDQCGAGQPAWVQPWPSESSPGKKSAQLRANGIQTAGMQPGGNILQEPKSKFQQETMSEEHKTAIIGGSGNKHLIPCVSTAYNDPCQSSSHEVMALCHSSAVCHIQRVEIPPSSTHACIQDASQYPSAPLSYKFTYWLSSAFVAWMHVV